MNDGRLRGLGFATVMAVLWVMPAPARELDPAGERPPCDEIRVAVAIQPIEARPDVWTGTIESSFEILVEVWNGCEVDVSIPPGQIVPYRATFPAAIGDVAQPVACLEGQVPVAGAVAPRRMLRHVHLVERCLSAAGGADAPPAVQIDGGVLRTSEGSTRFAPAEAEVRPD